MSTKEIMVSVCILTYNHEKYLEEALNSVLMQEVSFQYEIVIAEDCSTDTTRDIIKSYQKKFPDTIIPLFQEKNVGPTRNFFELTQKAKGRYIAVLEGDDFWNDSKKLQKQFDFLESHLEYIGTVHSVNVLCEDKQIKKERELRYKCKPGKVFSFEDYKWNRLPGHTCTMFFRNIFKEPKHDYSIYYIADRNTGDRTLYMLLLTQGEIYCMEEAMGTYRFVIKNGATNINSLYLGKNILLQEWLYESRLNKYCLETFNKSFLSKDSFTQSWMNALSLSIQSGSKEDKKVLKKFNKIARSQPKVFIYIPKVLCNKLIRVSKRLLGD